MKSLKQTRIDKGVTRLEISNSVGISLANLSQIENGKQVPTLLTRKRLELLLDTKVNWLDVPKLNTSPR